MTRITKPGTGKKVVLAMSGGVDSSAAAALLKEDGYEVVGCFMRLGSDDPAEIADGYDNLHAQHCKTGPQEAGTERSEVTDQTPKKHKQGCCSVNDAADARLVAAVLDIPFYVVNFRKDFGRIMDYFVAEYNAGRTPNPCVRCNDWLKFGKLHAYAQSIDADYVATGHYARIDHGPHAHGVGNADAAGSRTTTGYPRLLRGIDTSKDQSYVLFGSPRQQLAHMLLPIGHLDKSVTRQIAENHSLPVFNKPDSQEICFVPDNDYARLVERRTEGGFSPGKILDQDGTEVGQHQGHQHFTLGQRRGIGVALGYPIYVVDKDPQGNTITVGQKQDLMSVGLTASQTNWLIDPPLGWINCQAKVRYNSEPVPARVRTLVAEDGGDALEVRFDEPVEAVTPGQAVVCYGEAGGELEQTVLGGGWIDEALRA